MRPRPVRAAMVAVTLIFGQGFLGSTIAASTDAPPTIVADMPSAVPAGHLWSYNDFFPRTMTVRQGTVVDFALLGFHTAALLPTGTTESADLHAAGIVGADEAEADRNPNGTTHVVVNPAALGPTNPACGSNASPCAFDGSAIVSSGVPSSPAPFAVSVAAPIGTYEFHCRVHPRMVGWLHVVAADAPVPTPAEVSATVASQVAADVAEAWTAESLADHQSPHHNADGTMTWSMSAGTSSPDGHAVILEMLPRNVHIRKGDSVRWTAPSVNEPHTVTFPEDLHMDIVPHLEFAGPPPEFELLFAPGNGVSTVTSPTTQSDSGTLASAAEGEAFGLPSSGYLTSWKVSFTGAQAGTYHYVCQIHDGMEGTVTVIPSH